MGVSQPNSTHLLTFGLTGEEGDGLSSNQYGFEKFRLQNNSSDSSCSVCDEIIIEKVHLEKVSFKNQWVDASDQFIYG